MTRMIRKQVYIEPRHEAMLKRASRALGISEAELIRRGIERIAADIRGELPRPQATEAPFRPPQHRDVLEEPPSDDTGRTMDEPSGDKRWSVPPGFERFSRAGESERCIEAADYD